MKKSSLIGKYAFIKKSSAFDSFDVEAWGIIEYVDEDNLYHIAMYDDPNEMRVFSRKEFVVHKK